MCDDAARGDDGDVIAEDAYFLEDVTGEDDAHSGIALLAEQGAQRADAGDIEAVGWFVEQKILGRVEDGPGERGLHALTLGETGSAAIRDVFHAELEEHLLDSFAELGRRDAVELAEIFKIFAGGQAWVETYVIKQRAYAAIDSNRTMVRLEQTTDHAESGGFAGAVRSQ